MKNSIFLKTLKGEKCSRPPVWFMRQAGRVLPSYLKLREKYSFTELMHKPELAELVTLLPVNDLDVDAAILFSDILVIPEALGLKLEFSDKGPVFSNPIKDDLNVINSLNPDDSKLNYVYLAIDRLKNNEQLTVPLIGFCGGPFTVFCYMVQGASINHNFPDAVKLLYNNRRLSRSLLELITEITIEYAVNQVKNGVDAFQIFETHAGLIPYELYIDLILPFSKRISNAVRAMGCPSVFFPKGLGSGINFLNNDTADFIGVDWQESIGEIRKHIDKNVGLQGNLDPRILSVENKDVLYNELEKFIPFGRNNYNWIFNIGHGLTPDNSFENVKATVKWVKETEWDR